MAAWPRTLSTTAIHSGAALGLPADPDRDRGSLQAVRSSSLAALEEMRTMIVLPRADAVDAPGEAVAPAGLARLPELVDSARATGLDVELEAVPPRDLPPWSATLVTRIVREALTNAAKHASGSRVRVSLGTARDLLHVTVANTLTRSGVDPGHPALTGREREVLAALGCGLSNTELASALGITEATAKTHGSRVLAKLGHTARVQVAITAKEVGLAPAPRG